MSYKPGDFLIGVSELISIVLPGAIASYLLLPQLEVLAARYDLPGLDGTSGWVAFLLLSYLSGHLIFLLGSFLDPQYDRLRSRFRPKEKDFTFLAAEAVAKDALGERYGATNTYKFATALLALRSETALAEVRQFEADSKFFRSLTVLFAALTIVAAAYGYAGEALLGLGVAAACGWRYVERRWKATRRAFEYLLVLGTLGRVKDPG